MTIALLRCACVVTMLGVLGLVLAPPLFAEAPVAASAQTAGDDDDDLYARALFDAAMDAYEQGKYADSLELFEQAYAYCGRPAFLFNIGHVADRLRQDQKALDSFRAYLSAMPDAPNRGAVESRIEAIAASLAERSVTHLTPPREVAAHATATSTRQVAVAALQSSEYASPTQSDEATPLKKRWWLWTGVGAVIVASVTAGVLLSLRPTHTRSEEPIESANGIPAYRGP